MSLLIRDARIVTMASAAGARRGAAARDLGIIARGDVLIDGEHIAAVGARLSIPSNPSLSEINARGRVLMPAFVDCHTHACWAGDRLDEWEMKLKGASYLDILKAGGGIMSTVRAVRNAPRDDLTTNLSSRLHDFMRHGTTTVEVKSGYGLDTENELRMLDAITTIQSRSEPGTNESPWPGTLVPTALLGHAIDPGYNDPQRSFCQYVMDEVLIRVHQRWPAISVDAFCEKGAWSLDDTIRLLRRARELGHPVRVHADQFNSLGMTPAAVALGAVSVDHLESSTEDDLRTLAASSTIGVGLPLCGVHLDGRFANLRKLIDLGGAAAIATNFNPGSAPSVSMPTAIWAAVKHCGLTVAEAFSACTVNAAAVLGFHDRGTIAPRMRADLVLLKHTDERALAYEIGGNPVEVAICAGTIAAP